MVLLHHIYRTEFFSRSFGVAHSQTSISVSCTFINFPLQHLCFVYYLGFTNDNSFNANRYTCSVFAIKDMGCILLTLTYSASQTKHVQKCTPVLRAFIMGIPPSTLGFVIHSACCTLCSEKFWEYFPENLKSFKLNGLCWFWPTIDGAHRILAAVLWLMVTTLGAPQAHQCAPRCTHLYCKIFVTKYLLSTQVNLCAPQMEHTCLSHDARA